MKKQKKTNRQVKKIKKGTIRFFKTFAFKFLNRLLETAALIAVGYMVGLRLVKY